LETKADNRNDPNDQKYNYYQLAVQKWCGEDQPYQIHGLWPQINPESYPSFCENIPFNQNISDNLLQRMNSDWNTCDNNTNLWSHEWLKHGTCFFEQTNLNQISFFNLTLNLFDEIKNSMNVTCGDNVCIAACYDLNYKIITCSQ
jgi:ribonuclease I